MNAETIKAFQEAVSKAHWNLTYNQFCELTGFVGNYASEKFHELRKLNELLSKFDPQTLAKITGG